MNQAEKNELATILKTRFSQPERHALLRELGEDPEDVKLQAPNREDEAWAVITYFEQRERLVELLAKVQEKRPAAFQKSRSTMNGGRGDRGSPARLQQDAREVARPHVRTHPGGSQMPSSNEVIERFIEQCEPARRIWDRLPPGDQEYLSGLRVKFEPQELLHPAQPAALTAGFEVFTVGPAAENFYALTRWAGGDGERRALLSGLSLVVSLDGVARLRRAAGMLDSLHPEELHFGVNLDREGIRSGLARAAIALHRQIVADCGASLEFELNEDFASHAAAPDAADSPSAAVDAAALEDTKQLLQAYRLNLCLDDVNRLPIEARVPLNAVASRVKIDHKFFQAAFASFGSYPAAVLHQLGALAWGKPLIIEGVEKDIHRDALRGNWAKAGCSHFNPPLWAQGWAIAPTSHWDSVLQRIPETRGDGTPMHPCGWELTLDERR